MVHFHDVSTHRVTERSDTPGPSSSWVMLQLVSESWEVANMTVCNDKGAVTSPRVFTRYDCALIQQDGEFGMNGVYQKSENIVTRD